MNYEEFYVEYQKLEKNAKDILTSQQKLFKRLSKNMEKGDLKNALKDISSLSALAGECVVLSASIDDSVRNFDAASYLESGDYARQMAEFCEKEGIDVKGGGNSYEIFPYKVKIDAGNLDVYIDRKRTQYLRPAAFVSELKTARDKLMGAAFNPSVFASELAEIYDFIIKLGGGNNRPMAADADIYLTVLYKYLTPMRRFRKDYDIQSFAFDLARLYASDFDMLDDGRKLQLGPSRTGTKAIRILDGNGQEQLLSTIRFYAE